MTIDELYKQRVNEYQQYQVQKGIHDKMLQDRIAELDKALQNIEAILPTIQDTSCKDALNAAISITKDLISKEYSVEAFEQAKQKFTEISNILEAQIREALS